MWTVDYEHERPARRRDGGRMAERRLVPDAEGERLAGELERAAYLRTVQDWIIRPQLKGVPGVAASTRSAAT
jgi:cobalt-zinc-cadmium resistance protein CzcA